MRPRTRRTSRDAFTLVELLVVMILVAILVALLLPALGGAMRTAKNAAVTADINTLATALAAFKERYGDYPPSRIMLSENGRYDVDGRPGQPAAATVASGNGTGGTDITYAQLAQRSLTYLRKIWPRVAFSTTPGMSAPGINASNWYDFNGDGRFADDQDNSDGFYGYVLEGDACLTFFLGGIPLDTAAAESPTPAWSLTGWGKVSTNPFSNNLANGNAMYNGNRTPPLYEFRADRLRDADDPAKDPVRFPSYFDTLGTAAPLAYFSAYAGQGYDPNDCNWAPRDAAGARAAEMDDAGAGPVLRGFRVGFPVRTTAGAVAPLALSAAPNPYHASAAGAATTQWHKGQSFQIISPGADGLYGAGGPYAPTAGTKLPEDATTLAGTTQVGVRDCEHDDLTNFSGGPLD